MSFPEGIRNTAQIKQYNIDLIRKYLARGIICTKKEIAQITAGTPYDWGYECAKLSYPVHQIKEGAKLDKRLYLNEFQPLAEKQIRNAGYRLAALLNSIF